MATRVKIEADRYLWAIKRAGLTMDGYMSDHPKSAVQDWVSGTKEPTVKQLEDFAKSVAVPFGYLFLKDTPREALPFPMFRGKAGADNHFDLNVYDTVMQVKSRQEWVEDYLEENEIPTCGLVGTVTLQTPVSETVGRLRAALCLDPRWAFSCARSDVAVSRLTDQLEEAGIFVVYNGVVGNNAKRAIEVSECRGFALVDDTAPFIFVNSRDSKGAQLFTLVHEAAHIMLGVSAGQAGDQIYLHDAVECYCDLVAANFLVPAIEFCEVWNGDIKGASRKFKVSEVVIARRAHDLGRLNDADYRRFWQEYSSRPIVKRPSGRGDFYRTSVKRVGRLFAIHVRNAVNSRQLSFTDAYRLTGLHGRTYDQFMRNNI